MKAILAVDDLGIAERIRRSKGRSIRSEVKTLRVTPEEENELRAAAASNGKVLGEWIRDVLLQQARRESTELAVITELTALRLLLSTVLRPVALGDKLTPEKYAQIIAEVRATKHKAAQDVLDQYRNPTDRPSKEQ